ncbi:MAG: hypothetical protein LBP35_00340 [Candidatus Ancillula trichonymphae]|jgi:hypothetical protein|nr:hypothetical protein [Candidatus Ancillula trichonymphae]
MLKIFLPMMGKTNLIKMTLCGKIRTYYTRILFYAFLSDHNEQNLQEIIMHIINEGNNSRIAKNLNLDVRILRYMQSMNHFTLSSLDYQIQNINTLVRDDTISEIQRVQNVIHKFDRFSSSEIIAPEWVVDEMLGYLENKGAYNSEHNFLDIASKAGEFSLGIDKLLKSKGVNTTNSIYAIPTSPIAYEFTRRVYTIIGTKY